MVAGVEPGERPQPAGQLRKVVDVDIPAVAVVLEVVMYRSAAQVRYPGPVQRRGQHVTASVLRVTIGQSAPRRRAARRPDAAPSSWKPQPWYAPANTTRSSSSVGRSCWAATDSGVYIGWLYVISASTVAGSTWSRPPIVTRKRRGPSSRIRRVTSYVTSTLSSFGVTR